MCRMENGGLRIKQTYHGKGGKEGYRFRVYKNNRITGELKNVPSHIGIGSILLLDAQLYKVIRCWDDISQPYSKLETIWFELEEYQFQDYVVVEWKQKREEINNEDIFCS